jgi:hypothetical protein
MTLRRWGPADREPVLQVVDGDRETVVEPTILDEFDDEVPVPPGQTCAKERRVDLGILVLLKHLGELHHATGEEVVTKRTCATDTTLSDHVENEDPLLGLAHDFDNLSVAECECRPAEIDGVTGQCPNVPLLVAVPRQRESLAQRNDESAAPRPHVIADVGDGDGNTIGKLVEGVEQIALLVLDLAHVVLHFLAKIRNCSCRRAGRLYDDIVTFVVAGARGG